MHIHAGYIEIHIIILVCIKALERSSKMTRSIEFFAGLIGGAFAFVASLFTIIFDFGHLSDVTLTTWLGLLFATIAIIGTFLLKSKSMVGGMMLIVASIGVFFTITFFHLISTLLILIAGFSGVMKMDPNQQT